MNIIKSNNKENLFIILLFFFFTIIRFLLANFNKVITVYPDELYYYDIARSLFHGNGITSRGLPLNFQKIAYSIVILPTFAIKNVFLRHSFIALINSILMNLSAVLLFFISKKTRLKTAYQNLLVLLTLIMPDMCFSMTFMSENLYWPLFLGFILYWLKTVYTNQKKDSILLGILCYFCYLCKEISLALLLAYILFEFTEQLFIEKSFNRKRFLKLVIFLIFFSVCYLFFKIIFFRAIGNLYLGSLNHNFSVYKFLYMCYAFFVFISAILISTLFFPIISPILHYRLLNDSIKNY